MPEKHCGEIFDLSDVSKILEIDSPKPKPDKNGVAGGPYTVVHKEDSSSSGRWVIVTLDWGAENKTPSPCLGIRWFYHNHGYPNVTGWALWFIIPNDLSEGILSTLEIDGKIDNTLHTNITSFLSGKIKGDKLIN